MDAFIGVVAIVGIVAQAFAWRVVARGRDVWRVMPPLFAVLGLVSAALLPSIAARDPAAGHEVSVPTQIVVGLGTGLALYAGTLLFVWVARLARVFERQTRDAYQRADTVSLHAAIGLSVLVVAVGEELFWRGLVYGIGVQQGLPVGIAGVACWLLYIAANRSSRLLPILAAAIVGGALWTALAWWTGEVLAPIVSHMLWTGLMLGFPPSPSRAEVM
jgi:membrane protease YdiL (CAAX protease family)